MGPLSLSLILISYPVSLNAFDKISETPCVCESNMKKVIICWVILGNSQSPSFHPPRASGKENFPKALLVPYYHIAKCLDIIYLTHSLTAL